MLPLVVGSIAFALTAAAMRHLRRPLRAWRPGMVLAAALAVAVAAATDDAAPTGWAPLDLALRVLLAVVVTVAASEAAYGWVVAGTVTLAAGALAATQDVPWPAAAAVGIAVTLAVVGAGNRGLQAFAAAFAVTGLHRLDAGARESVLVALPVLALLAVPALHRVGDRARRIALVSVAACATVVVAGTALGAVALAGARDDLESAADLAVEGLELLGDDDTIAAAYLEGAAREFAEARRRLDAWWARPGRAVPVTAQHLRASATLARVGQRLSVTAEEALDEVDLDRLALRDGRIDLDAVRAAGPPAVAVADDLDGAWRDLEAVASPWLGDVVARALADVTTRLDAARHDARTVADVTTILPSILGGDGERRYLLLLQNPAEARGAGGMPGNFGEIVAVDGHVELVRTGRLDELTEGGIPKPERTVSIDDAHRTLYVGDDPGGIHWQNTTFSPDFEEVASLAAQLYPQSGGRPVDGVVSVDPIALDAVLEVTGPVYLRESGVVLEAGAAARLFLHDQYVDYDERDERGQRIDLLDEAVEAVWDELVGGEAAGSVRALAGALAAAVDGRHVHVTSFHDGERALLGAVGLGGRIPRPEGDGVGVVVQNAALNKMDWFVDRDARYDAAWDPVNGEVVGTYSVRLRNRAPSSGLPRSVIGWGGPVPAPTETADGEYAGLVFVYTAMPPTEVRVDGEPVPTGTFAHHGWHVTPLDVRVPSDGLTRIDVDVHGAVAPGPRYDLVVVRQASINGDDLGVLVEVPPDSPDLVPEGDGRAVDRRRFAAEARLDHPFEFRLRPE